MNIVKVLRALFVFALTSTVMQASATSEPEKLPTRTTPIPATTDRVPHVQLGVEPVPAISAALLAQVSGIPDIEIRDTVISLPGAQGFWLRENVVLAKPQVIVGGREFAHIHPDGSLHASLPPELAVKAVQAGWASHHPWADKRQGWEGFVMIYTPVNEEELDVVLRLIVASYNFVTGRNIASNL
jgi:phospholipase/carboxylesterase